MSRGRLLSALALLAVYVLAALGTPVGIVEDDAMHILLARALRHGAFALPDAFGAPVSDPLPGFAALLTLPVMLVDPRWELLRLLGLLSAAAVVFLTWRLARRFLDERAALAAGLLTALNPLMVGRAGLVLPDLPFLALSLILFESMLAPATLSASLLLTAGAGAATLLRPQGAMLVLSLGAGIWAAKGWRRASVFLIPAFAPLALWTLRNHLLTATASGYLHNLSTEAARLAEPRAGASHAVGLLAAGGDGLLALAGLPAPWLAAAGLTALLAAGAGTVRLLRECEDPRIYAIACYGILLMAIHLVWTPVEARYLILFLPFAWLMILAAAASLRGKARWAAAAALCSVLLVSVRADLTLAKGGLHGSARFQPATMAWLRDRTPPGSRVASLEWLSVQLLSGRRAVFPSLEADNRDSWLAWNLRERVDYLHVVSSFPAGGFYPGRARRLAERLAPWAASTSYAHEVYRNASETTTVFRIEHPDPARFLKAWSAYASAVEALRLAQPPAGIRAKIDEAVALEPRLALPWLVLAHLENDPAKRRRLAEEALRLDPTLELTH